MLGTEDVILILIVAFFLFGEEKLPELARSLGKAVGEFKKAQTGSEIGFKNMKIGEDTKNFKYTNEDIDRNTKIINLALDMGIDVKGKSSEQLIEEIRIKVRGQKWKVKN
jgi:sec-independent protein translocase protein TatA